MVPANGYNIALLAITEHNARVFGTAAPEPAAAKAQPAQLPGRQTDHEAAGEERHADR